MIKITRKHFILGQARRYKVFIDGVYRGKVSNDETKEFEADNGTHTVYVKVDWYKSNELNVTVNDSVAEVEISNNSLRMSRVMVAVPTLILGYLAFDSLGFLLAGAVTAVYDFIFLRRKYLELRLGRKSESE